MVRSFRSFAIVPAAGHSRRMQQPKLLLPWQQTNVLAHVLDTWRASPVERIYVVVRRDDAALQLAATGERTQLVTPDVDPPDMKASILAALAAIALHESPRPSDAWLVAPGDLPFLSTAVIARLLDVREELLADGSGAESPLSLASHASGEILVPHVGGRAGHPVMLPWSLQPEVATLGEHEGLRDLMGRHPVRAVAVDDVAPDKDRFHRDLDTPDDYRRALEDEFRTQAGDG